MRGHTRTVTGQRLPHALLVLWALSLAISLAGCKDADIERRLGKAVSQQVESSYRVVDNPLISGWVEETGAKLADLSRRPAGKDAKDFQYDFKVLDTPMVNAFAVPFGHVYLTTGLLESADSEDEVAAVLGHEWGHIARRHSVKAFKKQMLWGIVAGIALGGRESWVQDLGGLGLNLGFLKRTRDDERQADEQGIELAYRGGYDPNAMTSFFEELIERRKGGRPSKLEVMAMSHPALEQRITRVRNRRQELDRANPEALTRIAQGYLARYQAASALPLLQQAAELDPNLLAARRSLGDAYFLRGDREAAAEQYRAALRIAPDDESLRADLAKTELPVAGGVVVTGDVRREALAAQQAARTALATATEAQSEVTAGSQEAAKKLRDARQSTVNTLHAVDSLYDITGDRSRAGGELVLALDAAVRDANEAVFGLETINTQIGDGIARAALAAAGAERALATAAAAGASAERVTALASAVHEIQTALAEYRVASRETQTALPAVKKAAEQSAYAAGQADAAARGLTGPQWTMPREALYEARASGAEAKAKVDAAKRIADTARTRTLCAQIEVAAIMAPVARVPLIDDLVAHFVRADSGAVSALREKGCGYADIALALGVAPALRESPTAVIEHGRVPTQSLVDYVHEKDATSLRDVNILLKYLANALEKEAEA